MNRKQKKLLLRIVLGAVLLIGLVMLPTDGWMRTVLLLLPYGVVGWDVLRNAFRNTIHGQVMDENFLMTVASLGAFCIGEATEGVAVMLFYQVGELFQSCAVSKSRKSIAALMNITPEYANVEKDGQLVQTDPAMVAPGSIIVVKPGEKIPLDGTVLEGASSLDTAALTGESVPRDVYVGDAVISGCINGSGVLRVRTEKPYDQSTVAKIVALVENSSQRKAKAENFITKFARYYTPAVVIAALLLGVVPPLFDGAWMDWIHRALTFLVVSCPCALVISVPLSFFGGIGGASRAGILVKGGNYLEVLAAADTVVFDKTGTLSSGAFRVRAVYAAGVSEQELLDTAAHAEMYSDHPAARAIRNACETPMEAARVRNVEEIPGRGVRAEVDGIHVAVGNARLMQDEGAAAELRGEGTFLYVARDGQYIGAIEIADTVREDAPQALKELKQLGIRRTVMLTGDTKAAGERVAAELGIPEIHTELLPGDKVQRLETILAERKGGTLLYVGDGINDAPVLALADAGIAMGAMGSDAAIEAADVVLMDDSPRGVVRAIRVARRTMRIVYQNIAFALGVKGAILLLGALGISGMWAAVFADVGVCVLAVLNATRALRIPASGNP